jgi:hypothetical protein
VLAFLTSNLAGPRQVGDLEMAHPERPRISQQLTKFFQ